MVVYLILAFILFLGIVCKSDKKAFFLVAAFMFVLIACNTGNADMDNYKNLYERMDSLDSLKFTEKGFAFVMYISNVYFKFTYSEFLSIYALLGLILVSYTILKYSPYPTLVIVLYFIAPFFPADIIQIRDFLARAIIVYAIFDWIESDLKNNCKYLMLCLVAGLFHNVSWFFCVVPFLKKIEDYKLLYRIVLITSAGMFFLPQILNKISFFRYHRVNLYLQAQNEIGWRSVIIVILVLLNIAISKMLYEDSIKNIGEKKQNLFEVVYKVNVLMVIICVMIIVWNYNFYRIPRVILLINYISMATAIKLKICASSKLQKYVIFYMFSGFVWSSMQMFSQWNIVLKNNLLFNFWW